MARSYFTECFRPYYLWFIVANAIFQIGNVANGFQIFYFRDQLHLDLDTIGKAKAIPTLVVVVGGYFIGLLVDHWRPGRILWMSMLLYALLNVAAFFFIKGFYSLCLFMGLIALVTITLQISMSVFTAQFFPHEKLGMFCSANSTTYRVAVFATATMAGSFLDVVGDCRYAFLWSSVFYLLAVPLYLVSDRRLRFKQAEVALPAVAT